MGLPQQLEQAAVADGYSACINLVRRTHRVRCSYVSAVLHRSLLMIVLSLIGIPVAIVFLPLFIAMSTIPFQIAGSLLRTPLLGKE